jgi:hypothetical protein
MQLLFLLQLSARYLISTLITHETSTTSTIDTQGAVYVRVPSDN